MSKYAKINHAKARRYVESAIVGPKLEIAASIAVSHIKVSGRSNFKHSTGTLIGATGKRKISKTHWQVFNDKVYAAIQEFGGTIRPDKSGALTIPLTREAETKTAREFSDLFVFTSKKGNAFLARDVGDKLEFHYLLLKSVYIKGKHWMRKGMRAAMPQIKTIMKKPI